MPNVRKTPQRRMPAAAPRTTASLQQPPVETPNSLPSAQPSNESSGFTTLLDKVGGAIEGLVERVNSRGGSNSNGAGYTSADPSNAANMPANGTIKPIISRDESLE